jgi:hypothetical protein
MLIELKNKDGEGAWLDAFSIRYRSSNMAAGENLLFEGEDTPHAYTVSLGTSELRAYDVTNPDNPLRLTTRQPGRGIPSPWATPSREAQVLDYDRGGILSPVV